GLLSLPHDLAHAFGRPLGQGDDLRAGAAGAGRDGDVVHGDQNMFSCSLASSLMREGSHGGSNTSSTRQDFTSGISSTASSTQPGMSPATGQPGAVRVMSMTTSFVSDT